MQSSECGPAEVCARDGACWADAEVREVRVRWTLRSQAATAQSCANSPQLDVAFFSSTASFGLSPVTCSVGMFTVDKMPLDYTRVELKRLGDTRADLSVEFDAAGNAAIDLPY